MNPWTADIVRIVFIGIGATVAMDAWLLLLGRLGIPTLDFAFTGRWIGHLACGTWAHEAISKAAPVRNELALGWLTHYGVGVAFAGLMVAVGGAGWTRDPSLLPALLLGMATVVAPLFVLQPAMGAGIRFFQNGNACQELPPKPGEPHRFRARAVPERHPRRACLVTTPLLAAMSLSSGAAMKKLARLITRPCASARAWPACPPRCPRCPTLADFSSGDALPVTASSSAAASSARPNPCMRFSVRRAEGPAIDDDAGRGLARALDRRRHRAHAGRVGVLDDAEAALAVFVQHLQQRLDRGRRVRAVVLRAADALARHVFDRDVFRQGHQPCLAGGAARQPQVDAHVRVVQQTGSRALRLGHQRQPLAIHDGQAHQFLGGLRETVDDRLRDVDHARLAEEAQAHRRHLGGERVVAALRHLAHVAEADQLVQRAVTAAAHLIQLGGDLSQRRRRRDRPPGIRGSPAISPLRRSCASCSIVQILNDIRNLNGIQISGRSSRSGLACRPTLEIDREIMPVAPLVLRSTSQRAHGRTASAARDGTATARRRWRCGGTCRPRAARSSSIGIPTSTFPNASAFPDSVEPRAGRVPTAARASS